MQKIKRFRVIKKVNKLYKDYKILKFEGGDLNKEDFDKNTKLIYNILRQ